jgi:hypothetical protein
VKKAALRRLQHAKGSCPNHREALNDLAAVLKIVLRIDCRGNALIARQA